MMEYLWAFDSLSGLLTLDYLVKVGTALKATCIHTTIISFFSHSGIPFPWDSGLVCT